MMPVAESWRDKAKDSVPSEGLRLGSSCQVHSDLKIYYLGFKYQQLLEQTSKATSCLFCPSARKSVLDPMYNVRYGVNARSIME